VVWGSDAFDGVFGSSHSPRTPESPEKMIRAELAYSGTVRRHWRCRERCSLAGRLKGDVEVTATFAWRRGLRGNFDIDDACPVG